MGVWNSTRNTVDKGVEKFKSFLYSNKPDHKEPYNRAFRRRQMKATAKQISFNLLQIYPNMLRNQCRRIGRVSAKMAVTSTVKKVGGVA